MNEVLFIVADVMTPATASAAATDTAATAARLISQHGLAALAVVEEGRVLGLVTPLQLLAAPPYRPVTQIMTPGVTPAAPDLPLLQAYSLMTRQGVDALPVIDQGRIVGQITATAILRRQGQQNDPLTGLPSSAALRAWAMGALERGHEITILFIDLDNFGAVNKTQGHVVGDDTLSALAHLLGGVIDDRTDLLCRYGGDEFAVATTRSQAAVRDLMRRIQDVAKIPVGRNGTVHHVTASVGLAGGRRAEGRKRAHIAATVEDLLTLASRASTAAKEAKRGTPRVLPAGAERAVQTGGAERPAAARLRLVDVNVQSDENGTTAAVTLRAGAREGVGRAAGRVRRQGILFLVAEATLEAVRETAGNAYVLEELTEVPTTADRLAVVVLAQPAPGVREFVGAARASDLARAVANAILDALNRPLGRALAEQLRDDST